MSPSRLSSRRRATPVRFWLVVGLWTVLVLATAYLGTMTWLWARHHQDLVAVRDELTQVERDRKQAVTDQSDDVEAATAALDAALQDVIDTANDKAQARDYQYLYHDFTLAFKDCADARAKTLGYVQDLRHYYTWEVHGYDDDVAKFCSDLASQWDDLEAEANG